MSTKWYALVAPRKGTMDQAGNCLPFAQSFFGAPVRYDSAWQAWLAAPGRHGPGEALPDVPVLLWFTHYGTYWAYSKGRYEYGNWGHVAIHVPGDAIYTSPGSGFGQERYATIAQVEHRFSAKYVGWSEGINGLRVAELRVEEEDDMFTDSDRKALEEARRKSAACYDALFKQTATSRGEPAGVLSMTHSIYDAQFKETETSRGTPGGTLVSLREVLANQRAIIKHFNIEVKDEEEESNEEPK